jgi:hypothetical protein
MVLWKLGNDCVSMVQLVVTVTMRGMCIRPAPCLLLLRCHILTTLHTFVAICASFALQKDDGSTHHG